MERVVSEIDTVVSSTGYLNIFIQDCINERKGNAIGRTSDNLTTRSKWPHQGALKG